MILKHYPEFQSLANDASSRDRVTAGMLLRQVGSLWDICRDVACVEEASSTEEMDQTLAKYHDFTTWLEDQELLGVWDLKPVLTGKDLIEALNLKPGPMVQQAKDLVIQWQLKNPSGDEQSCLADLVQMWAERTTNDR